uniref:Serine and arginine rich splicing factor 7 n=1 Tax=Molossus molossus TaxID=27622 RepID=A0A7J8E526_MOLMO|nr:serine and arginine rich splicing factor 7 [Molossus molossus]
MHYDKPLNQLELVLYIIRLMICFYQVFCSCGAKKNVMEQKERLMLVAQVLLALEYRSEQSILMELKIWRDEQISGIPLQEHCDSRYQALFRFLVA